MVLKVHVIVMELTVQSIILTDCGFASDLTCSIVHFVDFVVSLSTEPEEILPTPIDESMCSDVCGTGSTVLLHLDAHGDNTVAVKEGKI